MRSTIRRTFMVATMAAAGAYLFAAPNTGCLSFMAESVLVGTDFCFVFDCQNGILGGTIDPCTGQPMVVGVQVQPGGPTFSDCP